MESSKAEYEKPFAHEQELKEKLARQIELNAQLDLENEKVADADLGGLNEEESLEQKSSVAEKEIDYKTDRKEGR